MLAIVDNDIENPKVLTVPVWHCLQCHHTWIGRKPRVPIECSHCKRRNWRKFPKTFNRETCSCEHCIEVLNSRQAKEQN